MDSWSEKLATGETLEAVDPRNLEVGDRILYHESGTELWRFKGRILKDRCDDHWTGYKIEVEDVICGNISVGDEFNFGRTPGRIGRWYSNWKIIGRIQES